VMAQKKVADGEMKRIPLLEQESSDIFMKHGGSITTITFFHGTIPLQYLRSRLEAIVKANPWLAGRLDRRKKEARVHLVYDPNPDDVSKTISENDIFESAAPEAYPIHDVPYAQIVKAIKGSRLEVKCGTSLLKDGGACMRLVVIPNAEGSEVRKFAVTLSMNHVVADGFTYYRIYNMLSRGAEIQSLRVERKDNFGADMERAIGKDVKEYCETGTFIMNVVRTMVFGGPAKCHCVYVDDGKIASAKAEAKGESGTSFVSTNDILTSDFGKRVKARVLSMAVNFRGRLPDITNDDAGNYERDVLYLPQDFSAPGLIRQSLSGSEGSYKRASGDRLPSGCRSVTARFATITNWASFAAGLDLDDDCKQQLHIPYFDTSQVPCDIAIIFRAKSHRLAVMFLTRGLKEDSLAHGPFGDDRVDSTLFP